MRRFLFLGVRGLQHASTVPNQHQPGFRPQVDYGLSKLTAMIILTKSDNILADPVRAGQPYILHYV